MKLDGAWEELFWSVFGTSSNPIVVLDERERVLAVNDASLELIGGTRMEALGSPLTGAFTPQTRAAARSDWQKILRGDYIGTRTLQRRDGGDVEVEFASRPIRVAGRSVVVAVVLPVSQPSFTRPAGSAEKGPLSRREKTVVELIALGMETPAIAKKLYISEHTVRAHVRNAMKRLGARTRAQLVAIALCEQHRDPGEKGSDGGEE